MAEEQSKGIQQIEGCEVIYDMGSGLVIAKVPLDKVKEQDINARIMKNEMQDQLTANIKKRGQLESLPLFVLGDGKLEIISGHHRVKSARAAEMKEIIASEEILDSAKALITEQLGDDREIRDAYFDNTEEGVPHNSVDVTLVMEDGHIYMLTFYKDGTLRSLLYLE